MSINKTYSVFVDGIEVNDYYLTFHEAKRLRDNYKDDGYDEVSIESTDGRAMPISCQLTVTVFHLWVQQNPKGTAKEYTKQLRRA